MLQKPKKWISWLGSLSVFFSTSAQAGYLILKKVPCHPEKPEKNCVEAVQPGDPNQHILYDVLMKNSWPTSLLYSEKERGQGVTEEDQIRSALESKKLENHYRFVWIPDALEELHAATFLIKNKDQYLYQGGEGYESYPKALIEEDPDPNKKEYWKRQKKLVSTNERIPEVHQKYPQEISEKRKKFLQEQANRKFMGIYQKVNDRSETLFFPVQADLFSQFKTLLNNSGNNGFEAVHAADLCSMILDPKQRSRIRSHFAKEYSANYPAAFDKLMRPTRPLKLRSEDLDPSQTSILDRAIETETEARKRNQAIIYRGTNGIRLIQGPDGLSEKALDSTHYGLGLDQGVLDQNRNEIYYPLNPKPTEAFLKEYQRNLWKETSLRREKKGLTVKHWISNSDSSPYTQPEEAESGITPEDRKKLLDRTILEHPDVKKFLEKFKEALAGEGVIKKLNQLNGSDIYAIKELLTFAYIEPADLGHLRKVLKKSIFSANSGKWKSPDDISDGEVENFLLSVNKLKYEIKEGIYGFNVVTEEMMKRNYKVKDLLPLYRDEDSYHLKELLRKYFFEENAKLPDGSIMKRPWKTLYDFNSDELMEKVITPEKMVQLIRKLEIEKNDIPKESFDAKKGREKSFPFSTLSYSASLFGGLFFDSNDSRAGGMANAFGYMREDQIGYAIRLNKSEFLRKPELRTQLFIPPLGAYGRIIGEGEYFHPRTKIGIKNESRVFDGEKKIKKGILSPGNQPAFLDELGGFLLSPEKTPEELSASLASLLAEQSEILTLQGKVVKSDDPTAKKIMTNQRRLAEYEKTQLAYQQMNKDDLLNEMDSQTIREKLRKTTPVVKQGDFKEELSAFRLRLTAPSPEDYSQSNPFQRILKKESPALVQYEDSHVLAFQDLRPRTKVHSLVIPKGNYSNLPDLLENGKSSDVVGWVRGIAQTAEKQGVDKKGYRMVSNQRGSKFNGKDRKYNYANQEVPHLHAHISGGECLGKSVVRQWDDQSFHEPDLMSPSDISQILSLPLFKSVEVQIGQNRYALQAYRHPQSVGSSKQDFSFIIQKVEKDSQGKIAYASFHDFAKNAPDELITQTMQFVRKVSVDAGLHSDGYRIVANHGENAHQGAPGQLLILSGGDQLGSTSSNVFGDLNDYGRLEGSQVTPQSGPFPHIDCDHPLVQDFIHGRKSKDDIIEIFKKTPEALAQTKPDCVPNLKTLPDMLNTFGQGVLKILQ